jgi:uncharacterized protein YbjT (DUF2867 family)
MADQKIVAVVGARGAQGGGLVRAIAADKGGPFKARALTRDIRSDKAKELRALGADVVAADVDDEASLVKAFAGADAAFCVTFYWAHMSPEKELAEATAMARAAKQAGVRHVIWSTLEDTRKFIPLSDNRMPTLMGKYKVPHFDAKGESDHFFSDLGVPTTYLVTVAYWDNFIHFGWGPKQDANGKLALTFPMGDKKLAGIAAEDIGRCAYGIIKRGAEYVGKRVAIAGGHLTGTEMAAGLTKALGREVVYHAIEPSVYRGLGFPGADDLGNMFQFDRDFSDEICRTHSIEVSRALNPALQTFDAWLAANGSHIPVG